MAAPESHKAWHSASKGNLDKAQSHVEKMRKHIADMEAKEGRELQAEKDRLAREAAEAKRLEAERLEKERLASEAATRAAQAAAMKAMGQAVAQAAADDAAEIVRQAEEKRKEARLEREEKDKQQQYIYIKEAIKKLGKAVLECLHESRTKFCLLKVAEMRMEMRTKRPASENFKDYVSDALAAEWKVMETARKELVDYANKGEEAQAELVEIKECFVTFPSIKNVAYRKVQTAAAAAARIKADEEEDAKIEKRRQERVANEGARLAAKGMKQSNSLPAISSPNNGNMDNTKGSASSTLIKIKKSEIDSTVPTCNPRLNNSRTRGEELAGTTQQQLLDKSAALVDKGTKLFLKMLEVIDKQKQLCAEANDTSVAALDKRYRETKALKKDLERQYTDACNVINDAERWVSKLRKREIFGLPRELGGGMPEKDAKEVVAAEGQLAELEGAKLHIEEDIRSKQLALKIEESCKTLVTTRVDTRPKEDIEAFKNRKVTTPSNKKTNSNPASPAASSVASPGVPANEKTFKRPAEENVVVPAQAG